VLQSERVADRDDEIADLQTIRIAERDLRQVLRLDLQQRDVGRRIAADDFRLEIAAILQRHGDLAGVLDHVRVGDDVAGLRIDDHAGTRALERALARL
jgi:hypothetical protein